MSIKSIEELLYYFQNSDRPLFYIGPMYGTIMFNIYEYFPKFEMLMCNDPYHGKLPFIKVPELFKDNNHKCIAGTSCQIALLKDPEVISYMKSKDPNPNIIYVIIDGES